jgi:hypothetical protein
MLTERSKEIRGGLELNGTHQILVYAGVHTLAENMNTTKYNRSFVKRLAGRLV